VQDDFERWFVGDLEAARPSPREAPAANRRCTIRVVHDSGDVVLVYEPELNLEKRELVFESESGCRRVSDFPNDWRRLGDAELLALTRVPADL
jgi:hypothetical protein